MERCHPSITKLLAPGWCPTSSACRPESTSCESVYLPETSISKGLSTVAMAFAGPKGLETASRWARSYLGAWQHGGCLICTPFSMRLCRFSPPRSP